MNNLNKNRVLVAMSGGVDSSVVAILLKNMGFEVIGVTIKTWNYSEVDRKNSKESGCCSLDAIFDAKNIAVKYDIPHFTIDFTDSFKSFVIDDFVSEYQNGRTPNPCVRCNRYIKWEELLKKADEVGAFYISTGHYSFTDYSLLNKRYQLRTGIDAKKDQSYVLWGLTQRFLERTLFPLGGLTKNEVRVIANKFDLKTANRPDSQEICFIPNNNYEDFLLTNFSENHISVEKGDFIYNDKKVGTHSGIPFYTIGQRRGLNLALGVPVYVKSIDKDNNKIILGDETDLINRTMTVSDINGVSINFPEIGDKFLVKIRYQDKPSECQISGISGNEVYIDLINPKKAIAPGQSAVFYDTKGYLCFGGVISSVK